MLERVYIVDEDVRVRDFLYQLISEVGYGAQTFPTGSELIECLKKERPALIIIEDTPGEFSGIPLARKVRAFDKDIKIVMLGDDSKAESVASVLQEARVNAYLSKDFQNSETIKKILALLKEESFVKPQSQKQWGRILIVDDEPENREMAANFLGRRGFEVETAISGEECLEKVRQRDFRIVLLDITMTGMDGLLTLKHIMDCKPAIKVVMVTAIQNEHVLTEARAIGAVDYIIKPFNLGTLESSLISVLVAEKMAPKTPKTP